MNPGQIPAARLANQQIVTPVYNTPKELVQYMGAIQAQDYNWVKWAMGLRLPNSTIGDIERAIAGGDIIRTHLLRPTWHFVAADDLRWMLELTAPRIMTAMRSRHKRLGLTETTISKTRKVIGKALNTVDHLTRREMAAVLKEAGYKNEDNLHSHLLMRAELDGVICSGPTDGKHHTYALFEKRISKSVPLSQEESLKRLAEIYFTSHGPATLADFVWWSGLTRTMARKAVEFIKPKFEHIKTGSEIYWFKSANDKASTNVFLLPAYDEFLVGYTDRSAVLTNNHPQTVISTNGIFKPIIIVNGQVAGVWKRKVNKNKVCVDIQFSGEPNREIKKQTEQTAAYFAAFLGKDLEIRYTVPDKIT